MAQVAPLLDPDAPILRVPLHMAFLRQLFVYSVRYFVIVALAHVRSYAGLSCERDLRAAQLEGQLSAARLSALQGQLRPRFLFNTLNIAWAAGLTSLTLMVRSSALLLVLIVSAPFGAVMAQPPAPRHAVLAVPARYPSIQAAIDSAVPGDTVLVAPGRYYENIRFKGKGIVVASQFLHSRDVADIDRTIIDGSRPAHPDTGTVVRFVNQEDSTAVLEGLTITGGTGTIWLDAKDLKYFREGGGVLCELGSPTIRYNHIVNNVAISTARSAAGDSLLSAGGGAIRCGYSEPTITNNVIRGNRGRYGGGVVLFYSAGIVRNNLIVDNAGGEDFGGAGLWVVGGLSYRLSTLVEHNTIVNNRSATADTAARGMKGRGGALIAAGTKMVFRNNVVWGNSQTAGNQVSYSPLTPPEMTYNLVQGGVPGTGNFDADPRFAETTRFTLAPDSPAKRATAARGELGAYGGTGGPPSKR